MTSQDHPPRVARLADLAESSGPAEVADLSSAGGSPADGAVARFTDLDDAGGSAPADRPTSVPMSFDDLRGDDRIARVAGLEQSGGLPEATPTADLTRGSGRPGRSGAGRSRAGRTEAGRPRDGSAGGQRSAVEHGSSDGRTPAGGRGSVAAGGRSATGQESAEEQTGRASSDSDDGIARPGSSRGNRRRSERSPRGRGRTRATDIGGPDAGAADDTGRGRPESPAEPIAAAKEICLRLLTDRARTRHELAQALHRKGIPDDAADQVLGRFDEVGLIDDAAFAGQWVRSRHQYRGLGRRAIAMELRRKGVADDIAGEALAEVDSGAEEQRARQLVDRKLRTARLDTPEDRTVAARRLVGMLARKGYPAGVAYGVVRTALAEHGADDELGTGEPPPDD